MKGHKVSLWSKDFSLLWITNFLMTLGFQFLIPTLPLYAMYALGASESQVGYLLGVYSFSALLVRPFAGYAYDYLGRRKTYLVALGFFAIFMSVYPLATSFMALLLIRFIHGMSFGIASTGGGTIVADIVPTERRGEGIGYFGLANTLSMALGPAIGLLIMGESHYLAVFIACGVLLSTAFAFANFISYPKVSIPKKALTLNSFFERRVLPVSLIMFLTSFTFGGILSFIIVYSKEIGIVNGGLFFLINAISVALTRPFAGKLLDRKGPKLLNTFGFLALGTGFLLLSLSNNLVIFLAAAFCLGIGNGVVWPTLQTMVINMVEPNRRGVANSTYFSSLDLGIGGGSILLGWLAEITSLGTMYLISGLLVILPLVIFYFYVEKDYNNQITQVQKLNSAA